MERCIEGAKWLIEYQVKQGRLCNIGKSFSEFQRVYPWTNEFIPGYLNLVSFDNKKSALAVMASGDHPFNLIAKGINTVDTFDTNRLTEPFALGFRRSMFLKHDYVTLISMMLKLYCFEPGIEYVSDSILELTSFMEYKHVNYWKSIVDFNFKLQREYGTNLNLLRMLSTMDNNTGDMVDYNYYLQDEKKYEDFRRRLGQANISFKCANAANLSSEFTGPYDFILLSNILDYFSNRWKLKWSYEQLQEYERDLESITEPGGIIFLKYIQNYGILDRIIRDDVIGAYSVRTRDLTDEEIYQLPPKPNEKTFDGMILKRVK